MRPAVVANLRRHAQRKDTTKTGLTREGINQARAFGASLGSRTKLHYGTAKRTASTGKFVQQGAKKAQGLQYRVRLRKELTTSALNREKWNAEVRQRGGKEKATRDWLDEKVPAEIVLPPKIAADQIIRKRLKVPWKVVLKGAKGITFEELSHQENQQAVLERLTGKSSATLLRGQPIDPLESIQFRFNITSRFNQVLALKKEGATITLIRSIFSKGVCPKNILILLTP